MRPRGGRARGRLTEPVRTAADRRPVLLGLAVGATALALGCAAQPEPGDASSDVSFPTTDDTQAVGTTVGTRDAGVSAPETAGAGRFPDVVEVTPTFDDASGTWSFAVTMSSPYDTPERYADGWRIVAPDGTVLGTHTLLHDHATEQPFTRTQTGVEIPDGVGTVTVEGRDLVNGFGGTAVTITLDRNSPRDPPVTRGTESAP